MRIALKASTVIKQKEIFDYINIVFLFLFIFQPELSKISILHFLTLYLLGSYIYDTFKYRKGHISVDKKTVSILLPFVPFLIYTVIVYFSIEFFGDSVPGLAVKNLIILIITLFRIFLSIEYMLNLVRYHNYSADKIVMCIIIVGILQTLCVVAAFVSPSVRDFFNGLTLKNADSVYILEALSHDIWRSYGFAGNIFDAFGYVTAFIIILTFAKGIETGKTSIIVLSIIMLVMPLLNARTGVFLCLGGFSIVLITLKRKIDPTRLFRVIFIVIASFIVLPQLYMLLPEITRNWLEVGLDATIKLIATGEKTSAYARILESNFIFPDNLFWGKAGDTIDVIGLGIESGYIQLLWRFGLFGTALLLIGYAISFFRLFTYAKSSVTKAVVLAYMAVFYVYLFKLFSIYNIGATIIMIGAPISMVYYERNPNKELLRYV